MWPSRRLLDLLGIEVPIIQAPMPGSMDAELVAAVSEAGGLGTLPCAMYGADDVREQAGRIRARTKKPFALNFFCHIAPVPNNAREAAWREKLAPYYRELGIDKETPPPFRNRAPFDEALFAAVLDTRPQAISFHFGLPPRPLYEKLKREGIPILSTATTVAEARWLVEQGVDAIVAQGVEAGGHRGMFMTEDVAAQVGTLALVPQVRDAVSVPVVATGGIADARGIAAAFALGADGVQIGSAYLRTPEAKISATYRAALKTVRDDNTVLTNVITGRPARGLINRIVREQGPISDAAPQFPLAAAAVQPLRVKAEAQGSGDFSPLWSGQAVALGQDLSAAELTRVLAAETLERLRGLAGG